MMDGAFFRVCALCLGRVNFFSIYAQTIQNMLELIKIYCKTETRKIMFSRDISKSSSYSTFFICPMIFLITDTGKTVD